MATSKSSVGSLVVALAAIFVVVFVAGKAWKKA
jgi:hypothetical protein